MAWYQGWVDRPGGEFGPGHQASVRERALGSQPVASSSTTDPTGKLAPTRADPKSGRAPQVRDDQPTVISSQPPIQPPDADPAQAAEQGKVGPGDRLGHFEIIDYIGGGGMARVFRAFDTRLARPVALKILSLEQAADPETRLRFHNEAQSAAQLDHENIARVYYVGEDRGLPFIVFEYIEGINIRALVEQKGALPLAEAVSYTLQIAEALTHAASHNVVHRDIKPSNVLITPQGQAKVIDMGLARIQKLRQSGSDLTASGVTLGTFDYISPEQARDPRNADVRSDIYSLGCAFFFMLAGRPPFPEGTVLQKLLQHQGDDPPDLRRFRPGLPDEVVRVVRRMLAKDPRRRYQDATELVEDLLVLAEQVGLHPLGPGRTVWVVPGETKVSVLARHLPWIAPITALVCIVVLLDFLWSSPAGPADGLAPMALEQQEAPSAKPADLHQAEAKAGQRPNGAGGTTSQTAGKPASGAGPGPADSSAVTNPPARGAPQAPPTAPGGPDTAPPAATEKPASAGQPNLLPAYVGTPPEAGVLRPDAFGGGVSGTEPVASGVNVAPALKPASQGPGSDAGAANGTGTTGPRASPLVKRTGILIVNADGKGENEFATLAAACSAASSGDVIELRYSGRRQQTPEIPIRLANLRLTIRAGEGFQPVVVFRPSPEDRDPVKYPRSMFTLTGGELTLFQVAVELTVPREVAAESWSLVETGHAQIVRLKKCLLTIRNASDRQTAFHPDVAFFRVKSPPGTDMATADEAATTPPMAIELADCVVRGEAAFLRAEDVQPIHLVWENGLLATTERLLVAKGGQRSPLAGEKIAIDLQHITAAVRGGLCRLTSSQLAPYQLDAEIRCADSIILAGPESSLVEQSGLDSAGALKQRFRWNGAWNFYEGFTVFWKIDSNGPETPPGLLTLDAWQAHWAAAHESMPKWGQVVWKQLPEATRPTHTHTPADYALGAPPTGNPARRAARDGRDVGFQAEALPPVPPPPAPATPKTNGQPVPAAPAE